MEQHPQLSITNILIQLKKWDKKWQTVVIHLCLAAAVTVGLMGAAARGVKSGGGYILGVIPKFFDEERVEAICDFCDELIQPDTMRQRKQLMEDNADAFIIVPGGIGTYEEFFEILTLKQLCRHNKPIALYNYHE